MFPYIEFSTPQTAALAIAWARSQGLRPVELIGSYGNDIEAGYVVGSRSDDEVISDYQPEISAVFGDLQELGNPAWTAYTGTALVNAAWLARDPDASGTVPFMPTSTSDRARVSKRHARPSNPRMTDADQRALGMLGSINRTQFSCSSDTDVWWPRGNLQVNPSTQRPFLGQRRIYSTMKWASTSLQLLQVCADAFEVDSVFYAFQGDQRHRYLGKEVGSYGSNFPRKYRDTHSGDSDNEPVYTIGTGDVNKLHAGTEYFILNRTAPGNWPKDQLKVNLQRLFQDVPWCHNPWCIGLNPYGGGKTHTAVPYPQPVPSATNVPGTVSWTD